MIQMIPNFWIIIFLSNYIYFFMFINLFFFNYTNFKKKTIQLFNFNKYI